MARYLISPLILWSFCVGVHADCFDRAAVRFRLDPDLLRAIAEQESRNRVDALGPLLGDGNRAVGNMQINTIHLPTLAKYGVYRQDLMTECGGAFVGGWILARYVAQFGYTWKAVGVYNTGPASKNLDAQERYIAAVRRRFARIRRERQRSMQLVVQQSNRMTAWGVE